MPKSFFLKTPKNIFLSILLIFINGTDSRKFPQFPKFPSFPVQPDQPQSLNSSVKHIGDIQILTAHQLKFAEDGVKSHNKFREFHNVPPMVLDPQLCLDSLKWAQHVAEECDKSHKFILKHSKMEDRGENIYACKGHDHWTRWMGTNDTHTRANEAVASWYSEISNYNYSAHGYQWKAGHFTQLVWKDSVTMGMAWTVGPLGTIAVVAQYKPFGNIVDIQGEFERNVLPLNHSAKRQPKLNIFKSIIIPSSNSH